MIKWDKGVLHISLRWPFKVKPDPRTVAWGKSSRTIFDWRRLVVVSVEENVNAR